MEMDRWLGEATPVAASVETQEAVAG